MEAMVIYDTTGRVWLIAYGETSQPIGVPSIIVTIPEGAFLIGVDVETQTPIFSYTPTYYANAVIAGEMDILDVPQDMRTDTRILIHASEG